MKENCCVLIEISTSFFPKGPINNKPTLLSGHGLTPDRRQAITYTSNDVTNASQIPQCTSPIFHNAPLCNRNVLTCAHFCYNFLDCCIVGFVNTLRPRQDGRRFPDDTFERIFLKENVIILIRISLKFVPNGPINSIPALVQIMAWHRPGDKPLSEPVLISLLTHVCVTRPQCVNESINWGHPASNLHVNSCHFLDPSWGHREDAPAVIPALIRDHFVYHFLN